MKKVRGSVVVVALVASAAVGVGGPARSAEPAKPATTRPAASYDKLTAPAASPTLSVVFAAPSGELKDPTATSELRWLFDRPVVDLTAEARSADPSSFVSITPPVDGRFRWASTRMLVFTPTDPLPSSTAYTATITGAVALDGTKLATPHQLRFTTPTARCDLAGTFGVGGVDREFWVRCDQQVDATDLAAKASITYSAVDVQASRYRPAADDAALMKAADPKGSARLTSYLDTVVKRPSVVAKRTLSFVATEPCDPDATVALCHRLAVVGDIPADTAGRIEIAAGLRSLDGPVPARAQSFGRITTARTPVVVTSGCRTSCDPGNGHIIETIGLDVEPSGADGRIEVIDVTGGKTGTSQRYRVPAGFTTQDIEESDDDRVRILRSPLSLSWAKLAPGRSYRVVLDPTLTATNGATLGYRSINSFSLGRTRGYATMRSGELVLGPEATSVRLLTNNVTVVDRVNRTIPRDQLVDVVRSYVGFPGAKRLDLSAEKTTKLKVATAIDVERRQRLEVGEKDKKGVTLVAVRPAEYQAGSRYNDDGQPWTAADDKKEADRQAAAKKAGNDADAEDSAWVSNLVQRTDLGITLKVSPANVTVAVTSLTSSKAVKGAKVELYSTSGSKPFFKGTTDDGGFVTGKAPRSSECTTCEVVAIVESGDDLAYAQSRWRDWGDDAPYYEDGGDLPKADVVPGWDLEPGEIRTGSLFTDRGVYKLGETAQIKGVLRTQTTTGLAIPKVREVELTVMDPQDVRITKQKVAVSERGSFDAKVTVPVGGAQGSYSVSAPGVSTSFLVTSFRKPDFVVDSVAKKREVVNGTEAAADVDARYLFGAPMANADQVTVVRTESTFAGGPGRDAPASVQKALEGYRFDYACFDTEELSCGPNADNFEPLARLEEPLDGVGHLSAVQPLPAIKERHLPYDVVFESEVTDVSRQTFAARTSVRVHPGSFYFGVKPAEGLASAGKKLSAQIISVAPDGTAVIGKSATVELLRWEWGQVTRRNDDGTTSTLGQYSKKVVSTSSVKTAAAPLTVSVTPPAPGEYELRVYGTDELGNAIEASDQLYAVGPGYVAWPSFDEQPVLRVEPDREKYAVGDVAKVLIKSPWEKAEGMLTIERGGVLSTKRISVGSSASTIDVPITEESAPNLYATVTLFAPSPGSKPGAGAASSGAAQADPLTQVQAATATLSVPPVDRALAVSVATPQKSYLPGADATVDVTVADAAGKPAESEVTLWAVDEGVLRLTGYTTPNLLREFYSERNNDVVTADSRMRLAVIASEDDKGFASRDRVRPGGGGGSSSTVDALRTDFRTLAVWSASVAVGANGKATVPVKLPEGLTAYRILAVAAAGADRFGSTEGSVEVRKPLMLQPAVPRFVNVGDTFEAGVVLFNRTGRRGPVTVTASPTGPVTITGSPTVTVPDAGDKPVEVRFTFKASAVGPVQIGFRGGLNASTASGESDGVQASFPSTLTQRLGVVATSGTVRGAGATAVTSPTEKVSVPADAIPGIGGLEVSASTSSLAGLQTAVSSLVEYPFGCLEQRTSRIRVLLELSKLDATFGLASLSKQRLETVVREELRALRPFQTSGGALSYWPGTNLADPYLTARTLVLLDDARAAKLPVPSGMIRALTKSLQGGVGKAGNTNPDDAWQYDSEIDLGPTRALAAYALARMGQPEPSLVDVLWENRYDLAFTERVNLLRAMLEAGETGKRPNALYADLLSSVRIENDRAYVQDGTSYDAWPGLRYLDGGPTNSVMNTGMLLSVLTRTDPKHPLVPKLAAWLVQARVRGTWENTLDSGVALEGLLSVAQRAESANPKLQARIALGTAEVLNEQFSGPSLDVRSKTLGIDAAKTAGTGLTVGAAGDGTLQWSARLRYAVPPARLVALDQGFTIERSYAKFTPGAPKSVAPGKPATSAKSSKAGGSTAGATFAAGDLVRVTLRITSAQARNNVAVEDLLPAGFEALNAQLTTTSQENLRGTSEGDGSDGEPASANPWAAGIDHTEIRDDRVLLFATQLEPGSFTYTYVARATAPGTFTAPPAQVEEMYHPEVLGRTRAATITITPPVAKAATTSAASGTSGTK